MAIDYKAMQREHPKLKAKLTRATRRPGDNREAVEQACRDALAAWARWGAWPDDWSRWQRALDDSLLRARSDRQHLLVEVAWTPHLLEDLDPRREHA